MEPHKPQNEFDDDALLARAAIEGLPADPADGLFAGDCWLRRISGESVVVLGGGRALLLEVAHPVVAAGVADHSDFRADPFGRLERTLGALSAITFADRGAALAAVRTIEATHRRVKGVLPNDAGRLRAGAHYSADDPAARRWVWATLVDSAVAIYECFVGDLAPAALDAYYHDHCAVARLLGVPAELLPADWPDFRAFFDRTVASDELVVDERARDIAAGVLDPPLGTANAKLLRILTAALLPEPLRVAYRLDWGPEKQRRFEALVESVRGLRGREPGVAGGPETGPAVDDGSEAR